MKEENKWSAMKERERLRETCSRECIALKPTMSNKLRHISKKSFSLSLALFSYRFLSRLFAALAASAGSSVSKPFDVTFNDLTNDISSKRTKEKLKQIYQQKKSFSSFELWCVCAHNFNYELLSRRLESSRECERKVISVARERQKRGSEPLFSSHLMHFDGSQKLAERKNWFDAVVSIDGVR